MPTASPAPSTTLGALGPAIRPDHANLVVLGLVGLPHLLLLGVTDEASLLAVGTLLMAVAALAAGALLHVVWIQVHNPVPALMSCVLVGVALGDLAVVTASLVPGSASPAAQALCVVVPLVAAGTVLAAPSLTMHMTPVRPSWRVAGIAMLLALSLPNLAHLDGALTAPGAVVVLAGHLAVAAFLRRQGANLWWAGTPLALAVLLLGVARAVRVADATADAWVVTALTCGAVGAVLMCTSTSCALRQLMEDESHELAAVRTQLYALQAAARAERARMHEVRATAAGIAAAAKVVQHDLGRSEKRLAQVRQMIADEADRLQRLMLRDAKRPLVGRVDLDEVVAPLVVRLRAAGHQVSWEPSGLAARADRDFVAEIVSVLLDNAGRHAAGTPAHVVVRPGRTHGIEVVVADQGPGLHPAVRTSVFDWGGRSPSSPGEGIGLSQARELADAMGGTLRVDGEGPGCIFVLQVPAWEGGRRDAVSLPSTLHA